MNLSEFKILLRNEGSKHFRLRLPDGSPVPVSFHVTEVARIQKTFIDCGGQMRESIACQLQVWVGPDYDHRLEAGKAAAILDMARPFLPDESVPVEIEYEDEVISQYRVAGYEDTGDAVVLLLEHKHTDCLAKERCGVPGADERTATETECRAGSRCCS